MRRFIALLLALLSILSLTGCHRVKITASEGSVQFCKGSTQIRNDPLTPEEVASVKEVLHGKREYTAVAAPNCGFSRTISITIGDTTYALATDKCPAVKNMETGKYIDITNAERNILEEIFTSRGGYFPCN
jgi:hypothetical protein